MKYISFLCSMVFFSCMSLFSQEKQRLHTVSKGETISEIAQKYNLKPSEIYELNPSAVNGIKWKSVLSIPNKTLKTISVSNALAESNLPEIKHEVLPKETVYGIAKQHHISIEELYKINPNLENDGLKIGQKIKIPQNALDNLATNTLPAEKSSEIEKETILVKEMPKREAIVLTKNEAQIEVVTREIDHEVLPKESLYSIAKKYGIKLSDLQKTNSELGNKSLKVGQKIKVPIIAGTNSNLVADSREINSKQEFATVPNKEIEVKNSESEITHEVLPRESLYSIAKQYGIKLSELQKANSELGNNSLKVGQKITVPSNARTNSNLVDEKIEVSTDKEVSTVAKSGIEIKSGSVGAETEISHEVLPKETKYGIAKKYGVTMAELEKQNPAVSNKLLVGSVLKIRGSKLIEKEIVIENSTASGAEFVDGNGESKVANTVRDAGFVDELISKASEHIGTRYRSGGTSSEGFDCSGLMCYTFGNYDIKLPRSSNEMASYGAKIDIQNAQKGDLIFFKTNGRRQINHVGMVVEVLEGEIKFIHSATSSGVIISSTKEPYYQRNLAQINRVL